MKYTKIRNADPSQFVEPAEMAWRYPDAEHIALSQALLNGGAYYPPIVSAAKGERLPRLVTGHEEVYAAALAGMKRMTVLVLQCNQADVLLLKNGPMNWMSLGDKIAMATRISTMETPPQEHLGRPKGPNRVLMEELAGNVGLTVDALLKRQKRQRAKARALGYPDPEPIRTLGMQLTPAFTRQTTRAREIIQRSLERVVEARRTLSSLALESLPYPAARLERLREEFAELERLLAASRPESLCPTCKATEALVEACAMCHGFGYVLENQVPNIPADLMNPTRPVVELPDGTRQTIDTSQADVVSDDDRIPFG